jgi:glycosyltransferase involved in cell wall biosynthesis
MPTFKDLPPLQTEKIGWPWTDDEDSNILPERMPNGLKWPRISIVTPSYNQGQFLEETIRSVLLQGYPNLEYIVIDGGSNDDSVDIIRKYEPWIYHWVSEADQGQSDAINKGFAISTGQIMGWINSDDLLVNGALENLAAAYIPGFHWWYGNALHMLPDKTLKSYPLPKGQVTRRDLLHARAIISQVSTFWTRELWDKVGSSLSQCHMAMDYELWLRFSEHVPAKVLDTFLGMYRTHDDAKTGTESGRILYFKECDQIRLKEYKKNNLSYFLRLISITFWTRYHLAKNYGWRSWIGRRHIPYV